MSPCGYPHPTRGCLRDPLDGGENVLEHFAPDPDCDAGPPMSLELPLRGGVAEGTVTASVSWTHFAFDEGASDEDSSAMVLDLIGVEEGPLLHTAFRPACFCNNPETDTQFWIWWNEADR